MSATPTTSEMLHIGGISALVRRCGIGPPLVLIHGLGCSGRYFQSLAANLASTYTVITPDLPGHGASDKPRDRMWRLVELTNWVALLIEHLALEQPLIIGHSLGGGIAVDLAWRHPNAASGLVLLAPTGLPDMPPLRRQMAQLALDSLREPLRIYPQIIPAYLRAGSQRIYQLARDQTLYGQRQALSRLRRPILILRGSRDPIVTWDLVDDILHEAHDAEYVEVPGAAHGLQVSHTRFIAEQIRRFATASETASVS